MQADTTVRKRALLTGASGFIGSRLARRLLATGWEVHLVLRQHAHLGELADQAGNPDLVCHRHDGSTHGMIAIMERASPLLVFHLASLFLAGHQPEDVERLVQSNLLFGTQLAEAMARCDVRLLVNTGTSWQHYENQDYHPVNLYAATKQAYEALLRYYAEAERLQVVTLKLFDTYGPGDPRPKLLHLFKRIALTGEALAMSPGEQLIDLVYIDDVLDAFTLAAQRLMMGHVVKLEDYAVSSGAPLPLRDLAAVYAAATGRSLNIEWGGRPYRPREVMRPWHAGRPLPGWQARVGLAEGIRRSLEEQP